MKLIWKLFCFYQSVSFLWEGRQKSSHSSPNRLYSNHCQETMSSILSDMNALSSFSMSEHAFSIHLLTFIVTCWFLKRVLIDFVSHIVLSTYLVYFTCLILPINHSHFRLLLLENNVLKSDLLSKALYLWF